jgi:hypothetical protein
VLAVVHDLTDYRRGVRGNFNEIQASLLCSFQRFIQGDNAYLFAISANQADF